MMARSPVTDEELRVLRARALADAFAPKRKPRASSRKGFAPCVMVEVKTRVRGMMRTGNWDAATARDFVALYEICHADVYGVVVEGMTSAERQKASIAAGKMLRDQFDEDPGRMANFFRWVWEREREREKWRRENSHDGQWIGWRLQFNCQLITQYRLHLARKGSRIS